MITWLLIFMALVGIVAYLMTGSKEKAVIGAVTGGAFIFTVIVQILLPLMLMIFLFKACFG